MACKIFDLLSYALVGQAESNTNSDDTFPHCLCQPSCSRQQRAHQQPLAPKYLCLEPLQAPTELSISRLFDSFDSFGNVLLGILKSNQGGAGLVEREYVCSLWSKDHRELHETANPYTPGYSSHQGAAAQWNALSRKQYGLSVPLAF